MPFAIILCRPSNASRSRLRLTPCPVAIHSGKRIVRGRTQSGEKTRMSVRSNLSRATRKTKTASSPSCLAVAKRSRADDEMLRESVAAVSALTARVRSESALARASQDAYEAQPASTAPATSQDADVVWSTVPLPPVPRVETGPRRSLARSFVAESANTPLANSSNADSSNGAASLPSVRIMACSAGVQCTFMRAPPACLPSAGQCSYGTRKSYRAG
jgi:hypothetical protein